MHIKPQDWTWLRKRAYVALRPEFGPASVPAERFARQPKDKFMTDTTDRTTPRRRPVPSLEEEIRALESLGLDALRAVWAAQGGPTPKLRSTELLRLMLAWRLQAASLGGLDQKTRRTLSRSGPVAPEGSALGHGAVLRRDWQGRQIEVVVTEGGFRWEDKTYPSLSAIARAATGTRWNGPRFFGLRADAS